MTTELTWKAEDIIRAVEGQCLHEQTWAAHGVAIDSGGVKPGDLFVALQGRARDRHDDVAQAFAAGAVAAIVSRQPQAPPHAPLIHVEDTHLALEDLGREGRARSEARVIAVGGSRKMESRDMLGFMLNEVGETCANEDGLDDRWGVPLSLARLPESALYGVFEIGMNPLDPGALSQMVRPDVALITAIEVAHLNYLEPLDGAGIGDEIFPGLVSGGTVVLNRDDAQFARLSMAAKAHGAKKCLGFGNHNKADARILECMTVADGTIIRADILGRKINYHLGMPGTEAAVNSLGALLAAIATGADRDACAAVLTHYRPSAQGGVIQNIVLPGGILTLIDEAPDTGPASMRFTIRVLGQMQPLRNQQRILVVGDAGSANSPELYADLVQDIVNAKIDCVFCCGEAAGNLYQALPANLRGFHAGTSEELAPHVAKTVQAGDVVTVKDAPGAHMQVIIDAIKGLGDNAAPSTRLAS